MTQEQKAKRYDEALERANIIYTDKYKPEIAAFCKQSLENIFPELIESEDEKIRKAIVEFFEFQDDNTTYSFIPKKDILAWLEKQGERKPTDKVEPKFHEGDFIVDPYCRGKIIALTSDAYLLDTGHGIPFSCEDNVHLWTIYDAKDGDVLASKDGVDIVVFRNLDSNTNFSSYYNMNGKGEPGWSNNRFIPATKEQRDVLFTKMKEEGYEWDDEKKVLKKIEQNSVIFIPKFQVRDKLISTKNPRLTYEVLEVGRINELGNPEYKVEIFTDGKSQNPSNIHYMECCKVDEWAELIEQKPTWSEEDKVLMYNTLSNLTELKDRYGEGYGKVGRCIDWLNSLKERIGG